MELKHFFQTIQRPILTLILSTLWTYTFILHMNLIYILILRFAITIYQVSLELSPAMLGVDPVSCAQ